MERMSESSLEDGEGEEGAPPWSRADEHELNTLRERMRSHAAGGSEADSARLQELERRHDLFIEAGLEALRQAELPGGMDKYRRTRQRGACVVITVLVVLAVVLAVVIGTTVG